MNINPGNCTKSVRAVLCGGGPGLDSSYLRNVIVGEKRGERGEAAGHLRTVV